MIEVFTIRNDTQLINRNQYVDRLMLYANISNRLFLTDAPKDAEVIQAAIGETVEVDEVLRPIYSFKAGNAKR